MQLLALPLTGRQLDLKGETGLLKPQLDGRINAAFTPVLVRSSLIFLSDVPPFPEVAPNIMTPLLGKPLSKSIFAFLRQSETLPNLSHFRTQILDVFF